MNCCPDDSHKPESLHRHRAGVHRLECSIAVVLRDGCAPNNGNQRRMTSMKRVLTVTLAFLLLGSSAAMARGYHPERHGYYGYRYDRGGDVAAALGAGIIGFGLGALAASQGGGYYAPGYVAPAYGYPEYGYPAVVPYPAAPYGYAGPYAYGAPYGYAEPGVGLAFNF
jgi:hypothetical protein